ncbi:unnamed protein product [Dicrocoelium dendriticum]|nr:unnamed protein product [Dicrocoelium dendriticum]
MAVIEKEKRGDKKAPVVIDGAVGSADDSKGTDEHAAKDAVEEAVEPTAKNDQPSPLAIVEPLSESDKELKKRLEYLMSILSGDKVCGT